MNRVVRHWKMENRSQGELDDQYLTKPSDWLETIRLTLTTSGAPVLDLISRAAMADMRAASSDTTVTPAYYCHTENAFELYPSPDSQNYTAELLYYQKIPALSDSNTSNWLLEDAPDAYLYGALIHAANFLGDQEVLGYASQMYGIATSHLQDASEKAEMSGSGLTLKNRGLG